MEQEPDVHFGADVEQEPAVNFCGDAAAAAVGSSAAQGRTG